MNQIHEKFYLNNILNWIINIINLLLFQIYYLIF